MTCDKIACFLRYLSCVLQNIGAEKVKQFYDLCLLLSFFKNYYDTIFLLDAAMSSGILKAKQKLGATFNSDTLGGIDFTKFSKLSMCSAGAGWYNGLGFLLGTAYGQL